MECDYKISDVFFKGVVPSNYQKIESDKCFMLLSADFEEALINHPKLKEEYNGSSD